MREYSLAEFAIKLVELQTAELLALSHGLEKVAQLVEKTAKAEIGHYQQETGPFPAWAELADSTKSDRLSKGYTENDPGLRSGAMRDSIEHETKGLEAEIGSNDQNLVYFELGTTKQEPRPVLGTAVFRNKDKIERIIGHSAVAGLVGGEEIYNIGYDFDV